MNTVKAIHEINGVISFVEFDKVICTIYPDVGYISLGYYTNLTDKSKREVDRRIAILDQTNAYIYVQVY